MQKINKSSIEKALEKMVVKVGKKEMKNTCAYKVMGKGALQFTEPSFCVYGYCFTRII